MYITFLSSTSKTYFRKLYFLDSFLQICEELCNSIFINSKSIGHWLSIKICKGVHAFEAGQSWKALWEYSQICNIRL